MTNLANEEALADRYGDFYVAVCNLPSKTEVDVDTVLRNYLSDYIHELQRTVVNNRDWQGAQIQQQLETLQPSGQGVFAIRQFERDSEDGFSATISDLPPETGSRMNARNWANWTCPHLVPVFGEQTLGRRALRLNQRDDSPLCLLSAAQGTIPTRTRNCQCSRETRDLLFSRLR